MITAMLAGLALATPAQADPAPRLSLDDLALLAGRWEGTLEYLDYKDNNTRVKLATTLRVEPPAGGALRYRFGYVEPNGKKVDGDPVTLTLAEAGTVVRLGDESWRVDRRSIDETAGSFEIAITRDGEDDDKPAKLRRVFKRQKDVLTIRTEVTPEGAEVPTVRNEYTLAPEDEATAEPLRSRP